MATLKVAAKPEPALMKVAQISKARADFEIVEREIPDPAEGQVRIKVQACGVCHSDVFTKEGSWPGIQYPRIPGHEVAGIIDAVGAVFPSGRRGSAPASAGTAAMTAPAARVSAEIFAIAGI